VLRAALLFMNPRLLFKRLSEPVRLVIKYALIAGAWIVVSDLLLETLGGPALDGKGWDIVKGLCFVAVTGAILYTLARRMQTRLRLLEEARRKQLQEANARIQRAKGLHAVLARANQAALTAEDETKLCNEIGSALITLAGLRFVWFSRLDPLTLKIEQVAWAGDAPGYLENVDCTINRGDASGSGPTGTAIREGRMVI
jgi:hypothetical protein